MERLGGSMAFFNFNNKKIYYEIHGKGKPIILLNGIMMSTKSWAFFVDILSQNNQLILLDFIDQGQSDRCDKPYDHSLQVEVLKALLDELKIEKVNLAGVSYGAEIALNFTIAYENRVERLAMFNSSYRTSPWLQDVGEAWNLSVQDPTNYYYTTIPVIYSPEFYNKNRESMEKRKQLLTSTVFSNKDFMEAMVRLTKSSESFDAEKKLQEVQTKTLIVSSENDLLTPKEEQTRMHQLMKNSDYVMIPSAGHASMYEKPVVFITLLLGFFNASDLDISIF